MLLPRLPTRSPCGDGAPSPLLAPPRTSDDLGSANQRVCGPCVFIFDARARTVIYFTKKSLTKKLGFSASRDGPCAAPGPPLRRPCAAPAPYPCDKALDPRVPCAAPAPPLGRAGRLQRAGPIPRRRPRKAPPANEARGRQVDPFRLFVCFFQMRERKKETKLFCNGFAGSPSLFTLGTTSEHLLKQSLRARVSSESVSGCHSRPTRERD